MREYHLIYDRCDGGERFSVKDPSGRYVIFPDGGFSDFLCNLIENCLLPNTDYVHFDISDNLPDYYGRLVELVVGLNNEIPLDKKPLDF